MSSEKFSPLYQRIYNDIESKILSGELAPLAPIPTQIELASLYNVSEVTSKRALKELAISGLIYRSRRKGSFVRERNESNPIESLLTPVKRIFLVTFPTIGYRAFSHPFFMNIINGLDHSCREHGISFQIWDVGKEGKLPEDHDAGFVLLSHEVHLHTFEKWKSEKKRMINIHFSYPHLLIPYIIVDNFTGGYLATQHLLALKHRRIGIILTGDSQLDMNQEFSFRLQGYKLALSQYNIEPDPELVQISAGIEELEEMGYEACGKLLDSKNPPTAIFATSDYKALGALRCIQDRGLQVPRDISIVGYDNVAVGQFTTPSLTTINQNTHKLGKRAVEMLLFEYDKETSNGILKDEILPTLIIRESAIQNPNHI